MVLDILISQFMTYIKYLSILFFFSLGIFSNNIDMRDEAIEARITPLGNACMQGDDCGISTSGPGYKVSLIKTSSPSEPAASGSENEHIVKMLNAGADGVMVFEPAALKIKKAILSSLNQLIWPQYSLSTKPDSFWCDTLGEYSRSRLLYYL